MNPQRPHTPGSLHFVDKVGAVTRTGACTNPLCNKVGMATILKNRTLLCCVFGQLNIGTDTLAQPDPASMPHGGNGFYHISAASPARNKVPAGMAALPFDLSGTPRLNDGTGAAGAFEYVP